MLLFFRLYLVTKCSTHTIFLNNFLVLKYALVRHWMSFVRMPCLPLLELTIRTSTWFVCSEISDYFEQLSWFLVLSSLRNGTLLEPGVTSKFCPICREAHSFPHLVVPWSKQLVEKTKTENSLLTSDHLKITVTLISVMRYWTMLSGSSVGNICLDTGWILFKIL